METRIQRHKNYRAELIKEGSEVSLKEKPLMTTTTLPIKDVIDMVEDDEKSLHYFKRKRNEKVIWYILLVLLLVACVVGLILLGILAFGGN